MKLILFHHVLLYIFCLIFKFIHNSNGRAYIFREHLPIKILEQPTLTKYEWLVVMSVSCYFLYDHLIACFLVILYTL